MEKEVKLCYKNPIQHNNKGGIVTQTQSSMAFEMPKDRLNLFQGHDVRGEEVVKLLKYKKREVSQASGVGLNSIRYDAKMPQELEERLIEWATTINLVADFFKDVDKTILWFYTPNPLLGEQTPRDMIRIGRSRKLIKFIRNALSENKPR